MQTLDLALEFGTAGARIEDAKGTAIGDEIVLGQKPQRIELAESMTLIVDGKNAQVYRIAIVNSGTADGGTMTIDSDRGQYDLLPAVASRLGNSVIVETDARVTISAKKPSISS